MDSDINPENIFYYFEDEWLKTVYSENVSSYEKWELFIQYKDLGIVCKTSCIDPSLDRYEIIDEKKWLINKIKYGF